MTKLRFASKNVNKTSINDCILNTKHCNDFVTIQVNDEIMLIAL